MASYYIRSGAGGAGTGANWANAFTTLAAAFSGKSAGDIFYVADDHAESQASAMTLTSPGTAVSPCRIFCVDTHATEPPTGLATSATITTTGANSITFAGHAYYYGLTFNAGTGVTAANIAIGGLASHGFVFNSCAFKCLTTGTAAAIVCGVVSINARETYIKWINTTVQFSNAAQAISLQGSRFVWLNTPSAVVSGTLPTTLLNGAAGSTTVAEINGVDLSALGSGKNLVGASFNGPTKVFFSNCKLGSSVSVKTGTITAPGGAEVYLDNCDSADTNYRMEHYKFTGSIVQETTIKRTGGASDGSTGLSWKMVSLASGPSFIFPLESPPIYLWNETTGSSKTLTVEIMHDSATNLKESEVWLEVEYLGTSGFPVSSFIDDSNSTILADSSSDQSSGIGTGNWTTTGLGNPNSQKISVTITPQEKGLYRAKVILAKTNYTIYVDPVLNDGAGTGRRQYLVPANTYLNEVANSGGGGTRAYPFG